FSKTSIRYAGALITMRESAGMALRKGALAATAFGVSEGDVESGVGAGASVADGEGNASGVKPSSVGVTVREAFGSTAASSDAGVPDGPAAGAAIGVRAGVGATVAPASSVCEVTQALNTPRKIRTSAPVSFRLSLRIFYLQILLIQIKYLFPNG